MLVSCLSVLPLFNEVSGWPCGLSMARSTRGNGPDYAQGSSSFVVGPCFHYVTSLVDGPPMQLTVSVGWNFVSSSEVRST